MRRQHRRVREEGEFVDPLSNYDVPPVEDELERALLDGEVGDMPIHPVLEVKASSTVEQALRQMAELNVASGLVVDDDDHLVGIFSERDVLNRVSERYEQVKGLSVTEVMTPEPMVVYVTDEPAKALNIMSMGGFRHIPVLNVDDSVAGVLGPNRVTGYMTEFLGD